MNQLTFMKKYLFVLALVGIIQQTMVAQNLLSFEWKFNTGDDPVWAMPEFDDSAWKTIQAGTDWENQGYGSYDGYAWYRQAVIIPASLKKDAAEMGGLVLYLGRIDDVDVTYWNGEFLGKTGQMPPEYATGYGDGRAYSIPAERVRWDQENTISVRVFDGGGGGGIVDQPVGLSVKGFEELVTIAPVMDRTDHLVLEEGPVNVMLLVENRLRGTLQGELVVQARSDFGEEVKKETHEVRIRSGGSSKITLDLGTLEPGFYNITATLKGNSDNKRTEFAIGVRPEEIVSPLDRPVDFEDYWMRAKRELDAVEPQFRMIRQDDLCTDTREIYLVEMRSLGNILIRGWYMRPVKEGIFPAILHVQGYSTNMTPVNLYPGDDMVALALNIRGHGNSRNHVDPGFPGYLLHHLDDRELYVYRGAYMDCIRAVDFLFSREEVDKTRVAVEGGSQGGALSFATAALDNQRISLCVPAVPFLSDFRDYVRLAGWPTGELMQYMVSRPDLAEEDVFRTLSYIDIKNLAPWIKAPVLMSVGLRDVTCPPHINFAAFNQLDVPKQYIVYPDAGHNLPGDNQQVKFDYIRKKFNLE
jgi:cephalosporin-C deacetylase-like acetyl esterase